MSDDSKPWETKLWELKNLLLAQLDNLLEDGTIKDKVMQIVVDNYLKLKKEKK